MRGFGRACPCVIPARIAAVVTARGKRISSHDLGRTELGRNFQKGCAAGEWPCEARDGPRGSEARRGRSRVRRGKGRGKRKELTAGPGAQRERRARGLTRGPCWQAGEAGGLRRRAGRGELGRALGPCGAGSSGSLRGPRWQAERGGELGPGKEFGLPSVGPTGRGERARPGC